MGLFRAYFSVYDSHVSPLKAGYSERLMWQTQNKGSTGRYKEVDYYLDVINSGKGVTFLTEGKFFSLAPGQRHPIGCSKKKSGWRCSDEKAEMVTPGRDCERLQLAGFQVAWLSRLIREYYSETLAAIACRPFNLPPTAES